MKEFAQGFAAAAALVLALLLLAALLVGTAQADAPTTYTQDEMQRAIVTAMEFGRQIGVAEAAGAIEQARATLERCAISRPI